MLPIIFAIISSVFIYRTARDNGFNAIGWTIASLVGFIVIQLAVGVFIGIIIGIGIAAWDWSPTFVNDYAFGIGLLALLPSIGYVLIIMKYVNRVPDSGSTPRQDPNSILSSDD